MSIPHRYGLVNHLIKKAENNIICPKLALKHIIFYPCMFECDVVYLANKLTTSVGEGSLTGALCVGAN